MQNTLLQNKSTDMQSENTIPEGNETGLIVFAPDNQFDYSFWEAVSCAGYDVFIFNTFDEIEETLTTQSIETLYLKLADKSRYDVKVKSLQKQFQHLSIIYYKNIKDLFIKNSSSSAHLNIIKDNFKIIHKLLTEENSEISKHAKNVADTVELLCERLKVSDEKRMIVSSAAYLHNFSLSLIDNENNYIDERRIIELTSQYLKGLQYSSEVCTLLDYMYKEISTVDVSKEEFFLANIITIADFYSHSKFNKSKLTPEEFKKLNDMLNEKMGSLFLPVIGHECIDLLYDTISITQPTGQNCFVLIYNQSGEDHLMLKGCLENLGFEVGTANSGESLTIQYAEQKPDILVIEAMGTVLEISNIVNQIGEQNINFDDIPTYLLINSQNLFELTGLLQKGIEDIFCVENDLDPFLIKIIRTRNRIEELKQKRVKLIAQMGTFGTLSSMNVIDLLQTMNGSGKTCLISVTAQCHQLTIYVHNSIITYAENDNIKGVKAIFSGIEWKDGIWNIDTINFNDFPEPNVDKSINSVLLEGCQYLDESQRVNTHN